MNRLLWVAVVGGCGASAWAGEPAGVGQERTLIEQEFYLPERPVPNTHTTGPATRPSWRDTIWDVIAGVDARRSDSTAERLGVSPLVRMDWW